MFGVTYSEVGATAGRLPDGFHHERAERVIGRGRTAYERACDDLFRGEVQRRAGAETWMSETPLRVGTRMRMRIGVGPLRFVAPCVVVWAERTAESAGFAYGTLPGHPERGEERFAILLADTDDVVFRITAFSAPGRWFTRWGRPVGQWMQARMTRRYLATLDQR